MGEFGRVSGSPFHIHERQNERKETMSMKEINALRHRGEGADTEVYVSGRGHRGWVRKVALIAYLARRGMLRLV